VTDTVETKNLAEATALLQTMLPKIAKDEKANAGTYSYSYAGLDQITEKLLPILGKLGLSFIAKPTFNDKGEFVLAYKLLHVCGDMETGEYPLPKGGTPQSIGSAITYARRYCLTAVTGIAPGDDDDDGRAAEAGHAAAQEAARAEAARRRQVEMQAAAIRARDKALDKDTTAQDLDRIAKKVKNDGLAGLTIRNETGDEEQLLTLVERLQAERTPAGVTE